MKKKTNSGEETLQSIRRNSAYNSSRRFAFILSLVLVLSIISISYFLSLSLPKVSQLVVLFIGVLLGAMTGVNLFHFLHAQYDQSDALIQVAKFQERSLRHRNDVMTLVEKIREEVEEEDQTEENVHPSIQKKEIEIKAETTEGNDE
jgi:ABC-type multidrug transport system fused ATPase/permease subunit